MESRLLNEWPRPFLGCLFINALTGTHYITKTNDLRRIISFTSATVAPYDITNCVFRGDP